MTINRINSVFYTYKTAFLNGVKSHKRGQMFLTPVQKDMNAKIGKNN